MESTTPQLVEGAAERFGSATYIEEGDVTLGFDDLAAQVVRAGRAFAAAGVEPGDCVGVWAPNSWQWIVSALGLQAAGATLVALNTRWKGGEAAYALSRTKTKLVCTTGEFLGFDYLGELQKQDLPDLQRIVTINDPSGRAEDFRAFLDAGASFDEAELRKRAAGVTPDTTSDLIFTSGTTGKPKAVVTAHGQNIRAFEAWADVVGLRDGDRYILINPFFHAMGYKAGWLACLIKGATALPHAVFDAGEVTDRVSKDRVSVLVGPPTIYQTLLALPDLAERDVDALRLAVTGAAPVPVEMIARMRSELGFETIITGYGLTECCGIVSMCRHDDAPETISRTSGRAIPDVEVKCVDREGNEVARGEPGEVVVRGYNLMKGYLGDADATAETIDADGWLHTGDIAVMNDAGYLTITDRIKDMYICGGFNCYPAEIENILFGRGDLAQVAVVGTPDERMGEVGVAFVVVGPGASLDPDELRAWSRENMANYKVPRRFELVDELPTNATGKIDKIVLREMAAG